MRWCSTVRRGRVGASGWGKQAQGAVATPIYARVGTLALIKHQRYAELFSPETSPPSAAPSCRSQRGRDRTASSRTATGAPAALAPG